MTKVIFLDIDGVMNSCADWIEVRLLGHPHNIGTDVINRTKLALLKLIIERTGAQVVLSSTWRLYYKLDRMFEMFVERGFNMDEEGFWHGITPDLGGYETRGHEVKAYLDAHPEITNYVILDDIDVFLPEQENNKIITDEENGLNLAQAWLAIEILNKK